MFTTIDINGAVSVVADTCYKLAALQATTSVELAKINANLKMIALDNSQTMGYVSRIISIFGIVVVGSLMFYCFYLEHRGKVIEYKKTGKMKEDEDGYDY